MSEDAKPNYEELARSAAICSEAFERMQQAFIEFSIAYVNLKNHIDAHHPNNPTLFDDKDATT